MCLKTDDLADLIQRNIDYLKLIGKGQVTSAHLFWKTIIKMPRKRKYFPPTMSWKILKIQKYVKPVWVTARPKNNFKKVKNMGNMDVT